MIPSQFLLNGLLPADAAATLVVVVGNGFNAIRGVNSDHWAVNVMGTALTVRSFTDQSAPSGGGDFGKPDFDLNLANRIVGLVGVDLTLQGLKSNLGVTPKI